MMYEIPCETCAEMNRIHYLGFDCLGNPIAVAGTCVYSWGDYWRSKLEQLAAANPGKPVKLFCAKTGIAFAGFVPNDYSPSGQVSE